MRRFDVTPRRKLGQNFLIDNNILDVIESAASLDANDQVLEIGGGLGVLSEYLADRVKHVHVVEIDKSLEEPLKDAIGARTNVTLLFADAVDLDCSGNSNRSGTSWSRVAPMRSRQLLSSNPFRLPALTLTCVMTQREVGERLTAGPGGSGYGATSVLVQAVSSRRQCASSRENLFIPCRASTSRS